jgi:hypothetical protein
VVVVALFALAAGGRASAEEVRRIAVLPVVVDESTEKPAALETLAEGIRAAAEETLAPLGYSVVSGDETIRAQETNALDATKLCDAACLLELTRELQARVFVTSTITASATGYLSVVRVVDGLKGQQLAQTVVEGRALRDLRVVFANRAQDFFPQAVEPLKSAGEVLLPEPRAKVPVVVETPDFGDSFKVTFQHPEGAKPCAKNVTLARPCRLNLMPGALELRTSGAATISKSFNLAEPGAKLVLARRGSPTPHWKSVLSVPLISVGGLAVAGCGTLAILRARGACFNEVNGTCTERRGQDPAGARSFALGCVLPGLAMGIAGAVFGITAPPARPPAPSLEVQPFE